ncbi:WD40 repeat-like protein [Vararia minispora EC-137]|uniref:WD40 repeat-like protein n=1 Tax=Vararia minispora EC-137 TaxID=1314806 RepID=A0ACB8QA17_9AGAM|nr:WD40 repeat-like protein [Vararia minispora EC-137]
MSLHESVLCSTLPSQGTGTLTLHDLQTGTPLALFKHTSSSSRCVAVIPTRAGLGGVAIAAQVDKAVLNVYSFQKDQVLLKCVLPERLACTAVDKRGLLCAGGTAQGRIYLWEKLASGALCNVWDAHYRQVTTLAFSHDGDALVSGSDDAGISVWSVSRLLDGDAQNTPVPLLNFSDHTLPITDVVVGIGRFPSCRLVSASVDCSVKLWDFSTNTLLTTFLLPRPISHVVFDATERLIFAVANGPEGDIYQVNLLRRRDDHVEAVGGAGVNDIIRLGMENKNEQDPASGKISVGEEVTVLSLSLTSSLLLAGTVAGFVHVYDVHSHQRLRSISVGAKITNVYAMLRPPDLFGHTSLVAREGSIPVRPIAPLQRTRATEWEGKEVGVLLAPFGKETAESLINYPSDELQRDFALLLHTSPSNVREEPATATNARVAELEAEISHLRGQLGRAKGVNDAMWEAMVRKVVAQEKEKNNADEGRIKKKGKKDH